jgi:hypothetical protein
MTSAEQDFLDELTALTKKHKITIGGCGCCGSPYLQAIEVVSDKGRYIVNEDYSGQIVFVEPDDYYWKTNKVQS